MRLLDAVLLIEGTVEPEHEDEVLEAWQFLIDSGVVWQLQGSYGRAAMDLINAGMCQPPS